LCLLRCFLHPVPPSPSTMADDDTVKGGKAMLEAAAVGMALFAGQEEDKVELDVDGATAFKTKADAQHAALEAEAAALTGKDNKKARTEKSKEASAVKTTPEYIDAVRVIKGQPPKNGNFAKVTAAAKKDDAAPAAGAAPAADAKKDDKKAPKKVESAGISKAERDELEKCKNDIIARKKELKEGGMSGGQMNKDEQICAWVKRMNDLKEKENPGGIAAAKEDKKASKGKKLGSEQQKQKEELEREIEEYKAKLKSEFGYSAKDIKADPDLAEMVARAAAIK